MVEAPLLLHVFPTFATGGAQVRFAAVVNHFGRRWRHRIVALDGNLACRERLDPDLDVGFPGMVLAKRDTWRNLGRCRAMLRALAPDLLVTTNWGAIEWVIANLLPLTRHVHVEDGLGPDEVPRQFRRRIWMRRLVLRRSTIVLPSEGLMHMARHVWRLPTRRLHRIPNGVDLSRFADLPQRSADAVPTIGTVAALRSEKNITRLLHAFARVRTTMPARLVIVGDGAERGGLEATARALGLGEDVRFTGHMAEPRMEYAGFDVFALSSDTEQMPLSVLEAMAARLPVAATDVGDVRLMLATENLPYVVPKQVDALAGALTTLLQTPALRHALGHANRARAERDFDQQQMFTRWGAIFDGGDGRHRAAR